MIPGRRILFLFFVCPKLFFGTLDAGRDSSIGWMAERSKALVSGTSLFGGEGSNPSSVTLFLFFSFGPGVGCGPCRYPLQASVSRLAQLVERKTLNLVVVGSSPTVGVAFCLFLFRAPARSSRDGGRAFRSYLAPVAQLAARRSHNPKVASSILAGSIVFLSFLRHRHVLGGRELDALRVPRLSVGWPSGPRR